MADTSASLPEGIILPPPLIREMADKTAAAIAKAAKPEVFEEKIRARQKSDSRFNFINETDAYYAYYRHKLQAFKEGAQAPASSAAAAQVEAVVEVDPNEGMPAEPPTLEFLVEQPPTMNAVDLDILRLTALFAARSGPKFKSELAARESRNYQFDFLRPNHSLFGYFNRLTEQYTKVLIPSKESIERLQRRSGAAAGENGDQLAEGRREVLKDAHARAEWEKWQSTRQKEKDDEAEAERIAFAEIDWQDFVVVSTIEFTEAEEAGAVELPQPMSLSEVENMSLNQKKMAAMIMEGREDEVVEQQGAEEAEMEMDVASDDDDGEAARLEAERQRVISIQTGTSGAPMKIRKDYVPKSKRAVEQKTQMTTFGNQQVPVEELSKHIQIELLDPRYKEQKRTIDANRSAANILPGGTDVSSSIRQFAMHRPDIFGTPGSAEEEAKRQAELVAKSKAREQNVWDGHTSSREQIQARYQTGANLDEQIEALHRAKGLVGPEDGQEPRIGPAAPEQVAPAEGDATPEPAAPAVPASFLSLQGSTISGAPQPPQMPPNPYGAPPPVAYNNNYAQGYTSFGAPPPQPPVAPVDNDEMEEGDSGDEAPSKPIVLPGGLPARPQVAGPGEDLAAAQQAEAAANGTRPAEGQPEDERATKKQRTEGVFLPEAEWKELHPNPITVQVELPDYADKPAWGCDGSTIALAELPLSLLVSTLRDRITSKIGIPISKQKLSFRGKPLANTVTLAALNFEDGDTISLTVKDAKKK